MKSIATWTFLVFGAFMSDAGKTYACVAHESPEKEGYNKMES